MEKYSLNIPTVYVAKDESEMRRIEGFSILLKDRPGLLREILNKLEDLDVNIIQIFHSERVDNKLVLYMIVEIPEKNALNREKVFDEIHKRLLTFNEVILIERAERLGRMLSLKMIGGYKFLGEPAILIGKANMIGLTLMLSNSLGRDVAKLAAYHLGRSIGKAVINIYKDKVGLRTIDEAIFFMKSVLQGTSWVQKIDLVNIEPKFIEFNIHEPWECVVASSRRDVWDKPYLMISILEGYFEELLGALRFIWDFSWIKDTCILKIKVLRE